MYEISVIMSTYNESLDLLKKSIQSILEQTYDNFEFIIVNDNPNRIDLGFFLESYSLKDKRIKIIKNQTNIGLPLSLNKAISLASGKYIARMDADDIALPNRFEYQLKYIKQNYLDLIGSDVITIDEADNVISRVSFPNSYLKMMLLIKLFSCISHPTWLGSKQIFTKLNGYRNIPTCEDYDFLLRAIKCRYKLGNLKTPTLYYRIRKEGITQSNLIKQILLTKYLYKLFKLDKLENIEKVETYLCSDCYKHRYNDYNNYYKKKKKIKSCKNFIDKLIIFVLLLCDKIFYVRVYSYFIKKIIIVSNCR